MKVFVLALLCLVAAVESQKPEKKDCEIALDLHEYYYQLRKAGKREGLWDNGDYLVDSSVSNCRVTLY